MVGRVDVDIAGLMCEGKIIGYGKERLGVCTSTCFAYAGFGGSLL